MIHWGGTRGVGWLLGLVMLSSLLPRPSLDLRASESVDIPEKTGYFDGRFWRIGVRPNGQSQLAVDALGRLYVSGSDLGTTAWVFPDIARWDGRRWEALATNATRVNALLPLGSDLVVAGRFTDIDGLPLNRIARFDGSGWHPMGDGLGGLNAEVLALAAADGQFYAGGRFTNASPLSLANIARWDIASETWHALGDGLPGEVRAIAASENGLFAGAGEQVHRWTGSAWELLGTFGGQAGSTAQILALQWRDDALYVGGFFASVDALEASVVVRWRNGRWERPGLKPIDGMATGMTWVENRLWLAGRFQLPDQPAVSSVKVVSLTGDAWQVELEVNSRFVAQALCHRGPEVFVLDMPTLKEATYGSDLVLWHRHDNRWTPVKGGLAPVPDTTGVALSPDGVAVGGVGGSCPMQYDGSEFRHTSGGRGTVGVPIQIGRALPGSARQAYAAGSVPVNDHPVFVARLEGDLWQPVTTPSPLPTIVHVAPGENRLAVAGYRTPSSGGEVWEWTGTAWKPLGDRFEPAPATGSGTNPSRIQSLAWHEGRLYAGCIASTMGGQVYSNLVVWDGARWQPSVLQPNKGIHSSLSPSLPRT